ncbi:MAG: nucleotide pyrophosphohydrolase [Robinsoniella sp.]|nr:nucleotide pyrophosphohydrolase [Robinsoniella sp.]
MQKFRDIVSKLRSEEGCPWDRAQTHQSLKPCIINETAEVLAAIDLYEESKDAENLCEELGDLLLLLVLNSQIAQEEGLFTFDDVIEAISQKMIRRHPHVFQTEENKGINPGWQEIKRQEKSRKSEDFFEAQKKAVHRAHSEMIDYLKSEMEKENL